MKLNISFLKKYLSLFGKEIFEGLLYLGGQFARDDPIMLDKLNVKTVVDVSMIPDLPKEENRKYFEYEIRGNNKLVEFFFLKKLQII